MPPAHQPRAHGRTWPQRLVIVTGSMVVLACVAGATAAGYFGLRFSQIDRVGDIEISAAAAGQPANFLLVGTDSREGLDPDLSGFTDDGQTGCNCTDTIMVLRVDPKAKEAQILSFPRDLWLPLAPSGKSGRINGAYAKGEQALIDTIEQNFDIPINHYVEIDFVGFERLVDAVGGIPMWFDAPVRDKHTGLSVPEPECQVLDGEQARKFVRSRYLEYKGDDGRWHSDPTADLGRITRQQIFIRSAISKAVGKGLTNPVTLNELVSAGVENVRLALQLDAGAARRLECADCESDGQGTQPPRAIGRRCGLGASRDQGAARVGRHARHAAGARQRADELFILDRHRGGKHHRHARQREFAGPGQGSALQQTKHDQLTKSD